MAGIARMRAVALDCPDPRALAEFYRELTGWQITYADEDWINLEGDGPVRLSFQRAPDHKPPVWPDPEHPQQLHLDLFVDDAEASEQRVLALGATKPEYQPGHQPDGNWRVYLDPAGHPFCLCTEE